MKKKFSLRSQLIVILIVFVVGILGLVFLFQTTFLNDYYKRSKASSLQSVINRVINSIDSKSLEDVIDEVSMSNEVCVRVVSDNPKYNIEKACSLRSLDNQTINHLANETLNNNGEKLFDNFTYQSIDEKSEVYIYSKIINHNNQYILILASSMITPLSATISTLKSQYGIIALIVIVMAVLMALLISRLLIRPIKKINDESKNLSKGLYKSPLKFISKEFNELNDTLNSANDDILKADRARKELLANVSHDLRTPLTMIVGYGEMIRDIKEENNEENINVIIDEAKRLSTLVDDLIDISRLESDSIELHKDNVSINDLLTSVYHQYEKFCKAQNVDFKLNLIEDKFVELDINRIKQVLYNFINNALNYNDNDFEEITLGVEKYFDLYRIYVLDNGRGIDEKDIDRIWDRYYKVDKNHRRHHIGSGIGLSLSKQLLEAHGLNYGVDSKVGEYSKFYFDV